MFTGGAIVLLALIGWSVTRANQKDPPSRQDDREVRDLIRYTRQDIRLTAYLLAGILVMLGVIADRVH